MRKNFLKNRKRSEIIAFLWSAAAVLLFLCLSSYTPDDVAYEISTPSTPSQNLVGVSGAYISWGLNVLFGKGSFFFVVLFLFWALAAWSDRKTQSVWSKLLSGTIFFVSACSSLSLLASESSLQFQRGGLVGFFLAHFFQDLFGQAALYITGTLFVLSILLATEFLVLPVVGLFFKTLGLKTANHIWNLIKSDKHGPAPSKTQKATSASNAQQILKKTKTNAIIFKKADEQLAKPRAPLIRTVQPTSAVNTPAAKVPVPKREATSAVTKSASTDAPPPEFFLPPLNLLHDGVASTSVETKAEIEQQSHILEQTLADFGIDAKVVEVEQGPTITRYELLPASGVKIQKIVSLSDNIALAMQATSVRIVAPIPGKSRIGIEIPNEVAARVALKDILASSQFKRTDSKLLIGIGKDAAGIPIVADLDDMPHLLIAGSTGSGKTVCVNSIIVTLLYNATPEEVRLILIDPKMVELATFNNIPHLLAPVVTEADKVPAVLHWLVREMESRYKTLSKRACRNISAFNAKVVSKQIAEKRMPYIVTVIDELADLMMTSGKEVENTITRLAQLARAVGIHLILATQRPSVNVITGVIKANFPSRIAFQVATKVDSRTILDVNGAEALIGKGDLLFLDPTKPKPIRGQGAFLADAEIEAVTDFIRDQRKCEYDEEVTHEQTKSKNGTRDFRKDEHYAEACQVIVNSGQASVSMLQRRLGLGYTRAARLVDMMEEDGIVGPHRGAKPREIMIDIETLIEREKSQAAESKKEGEA